MVSIDGIADTLVFISGIMLLIYSIVFLQLYSRFKKRDYFLLTLGFFAAAIQATVGELDILFSDDWDSEVLELISAIFSLVMVSIIGFVLIFPHRVPINFEDEIVKNKDEE